MKKSEFLKKWLPAIESLHGDLGPEFEEDLKRINKAGKKAPKIYGFEVRKTYDSILHYFPGSLSPENSEQTKERWLDEIDKLIKIEKLTPTQIMALCSWARSDDFWSSNFLSILKLRRKNKDGVKYYLVFASYIQNKKIYKSNGRLTEEQKQYLVNQDDF